MEPFASVTAAIYTNVLLSLDVIFRRLPALSFKLCDNKNCYHL